MIYLTYQIRKIEKELNILRELFILIGLFILKLVFKTIINIVEVIENENFFLSWFDSTKYAYVSVFLLLLIIIYSGIVFVSDSYKPNELVPYPTSEDCILSFDLAIITPTTMKFFYDYLENSDQFKEGLIIYSLHADIRIYMKMLDEKYLYSIEEIK